MIVAHHTVLLMVLTMFVILFSDDPLFVNAHPCKKNIISAVRWGKIIEFIPVIKPYYQIYHMRTNASIKIK